MKVSSLNSKVSILKMRKSLNKIITLLEKAKIDEPMKGKWAGMEQTELDGVPEGKLEQKKPN